MPCDLLSAANMRRKLTPASPIAAASYRHVLTMPAATDAERGMASAKLSTVEQSLREANEKVELV